MQEVLDINQDDIEKAAFHRFKKESSSMQKRLGFISGCD
jgi:hypothetical protein